MFCTSSYPGPPSFRHCCLFLHCLLPSPPTSPPHTKIVPTKWEGKSLLSWADCLSKHVKVEMHVVILGTMKKSVWFEGIQETTEALCELECWPPTRPLWWEVWKTLEMERNRWHNRRKAREACLFPEPIHRSSQGWEWENTLPLWDFY